jgi:hypothetical protein
MAKIIVRIQAKSIKTPGTGSSSGAAGPVWGIKYSHCREY